MWNPIEPIEKILDQAIESGNIKWYIAIFLFIGLYLAFFN